MSGTSISRGRFITLEGQDGAGKTTNLDEIERVVTGAGYDLLRTREPGGTALGDNIRRLVLHGDEMNIDPMAELLLIFAARAQHLSEVIKPTLATGAWVLCDRFTDATYAYQGGGRGIDEARIEQLETLVQGSLRPDLTLLLDVEIETGAARSGTGGNPDRFESEATGFRTRVREAYLQRADLDPARFRVIDAERSLDEVRRQVEDTLLQFIDTLNN